MSRISCAFILIAILGTAAGCWIGRTVGYYEAQRDAIMAGSAYYHPKTGKVIFGNIDFEAIDRVLPKVNSGELNENKCVKNCESQSEQTTPKKKPTKEEREASRKMGIVILEDKK